MRLGIIAGNRDLPLVFVQSARTAQPTLQLIAFCFYGETNPFLARFVDKALWFHVGEFNRLVRSIEEQQVQEIVMVGQIHPRRIFQRKHWDEQMYKVIAQAGDFRPHTVFGEFIKAIEAKGVKFLESTIFLEQFLAQEGVMNQIKVKNKLLDDISFGAEIASRYVELDVGQCITVKDTTVISLEGIEGTDNAIKRGYRFAKKGIVVFKFSKKNQDLRFDVPIVGMRTLNLLKRIGAAGLVLEAKRVLILEKERFLSLARRANIPVVGITKLVLSSEEINSDSSANC